MPEIRSYAVVLEPDADRGFTAIIPALPGVVTEGDTIEEIFANVREAIELCIADMRAQGLEIPESDTGARMERIEIPIAS